MSTTDQNPQLQLDALEEAGATRIYTDYGVSGAAACRPHLDACLDHLREGDVLTVWKLDRLGRNTQHVLAVVAIAAFALVGVVAADRTCSPPLSRADDGCGPGMSYNYETLNCEPWVEVNPYIDPYIPVPFPTWNPIDIDLNPGGPGGIGRLHGLSCKASPPRCDPCASLVRSRSAPVTSPGSMTRWRADQ